jgi:glycosyltransferase involved in cell wall biosynthesis
MRILILTFYYRPDLSAGSFRATALVDVLQTKVPPGSHIDVITTLPNRYRSFSADAPVREEANGVSIERIELRAHKSGMVDQSAAFMAFARGVMAITARREYDLVFVTSSRLMTAVLGARIARKKGAKLYLDIRDIFADTIKDVLQGRSGRIAERVFSVLESYAVRRASRVNVVSEGFLDYFRNRYPRQQFACFSNGIDDEFLAASPTERSPSPRNAGADTLTVLYAGNVGEGQGLNLVVPSLAKALGSRVRFQIIGDGGRIEALRNAISEAAVTNVDVLPPVGRRELIDAYRAADILFLHLNDYPAFERVLPSKVFEYAAMGKPVWAGLAGFSAQFVTRHVTNAAVFRPCDVVGALEALDHLVLEDAPRTEFLARYSRAEVSSRLADDILAIVR